MPAAITTPFGIGLGSQLPRKDIFQEDTVAESAGRMKIFLSSAVPPNRIQSIVGALQIAFNQAVQSARQGVSTDIFALVDWTEGSPSNVRVQTTSAGITTTDCAIVISNTFSPNGQTQFWSETFDELISGLIERAKGT